MDTPRGRLYTLQAAGATAALPDTPQGLKQGSRSAGGGADSQPAPGRWREGPRAAPGGVSGALPILNNPPLWAHADPPPQFLVTSNFHLGLVVALARQPCRQLHGSQCQVEKGVVPDPAPVGLIQPHRTC